MADITDRVEITTLTFPPQIEFGIGAIKNLGKWVKTFNAKSPLIVTDEGIIKADILPKIIKPLEEVNLQYDILYHNKVLKLLGILLLTGAVLNMIVTIKSNQTQLIKMLMTERQSVVMDIMT